MVKIGGKIMSKKTKEHIATIMLFIMLFEVI